MNVTVFGATGAVGQHLVHALLAKGATVTAYVRNEAKIPAAWNGTVRVVVGEITDAEAIDKAITGTDAVASALGPSMDRKATGLPLAEGNRLIVAAMDRHGVRRDVGNGTHRARPAGPPHVPATVQRAHGPHVPAPRIRRDGPDVEGNHHLGS